MELDGGPSEILSHTSPSSESSDSVLEEVGTEGPQ